jgi:hypothetical protein
LIATQELSENAVCILGVSPSVSQIQREEAAEIAARFNFNFKQIKPKNSTIPNYQANPNNRCYFCKTELYGKLSALRKRKISNISLTEPTPTTSAITVREKRRLRKKACAVRWSKRFEAKTKSEN